MWRANRTRLNLATHQRETERGFWVTTARLMADSVVFLCHRKLPIFAADVSLEWQEAITRGGWPMPAEPRTASSRQAADVKPSPRVEAIICHTWEQWANDTSQANGHVTSQTTPPPPLFFALLSWCCCKCSGGDMHKFIAKNRTKKSCRRQNQDIGDTTRWQTFAEVRMRYMSCTRELNAEVCTTTVTCKKITVSHLCTQFKNKLGRQLVIIAVLGLYYSKKCI